MRLIIILYNVKREPCIVIGAHKFFVPPGPTRIQRCPLVCVQAWESLLLAEIERHLRRQSSAKVCPH